MIGAGMGAAYALLRLMRALIDPTGPGGPLEGMEANFPGNDGAAFILMLPSLVGLTAAGAFLGAIGARLLLRLRKQSNLRPS